MIEHCGERGCPTCADWGLPEPGRPVAVQSRAGPVGSAPLFSWCSCTCDACQGRGGPGDGECDHCGAAGCTGPEQRAMAGDGSPPSFYACPRCRHAVSYHRDCLYCGYQVRRVRQEGGSDDLDAGQLDDYTAPGGTAQAVRDLLAALEARYADAD